MAIHDMKRDERIRRVLSYLEGRYPGMGFFGKREPFRVLVSTVLSQRTRDENTDKASRKLFSRFRTPRELAGARVREIEKLIKEAGFYRVKAAKIREISRILVDKHGGRVPRDMGRLMELPGVGKKTASCALLYGFGEPCIPVDVHVAVISRRLGLAREREPGRIQEELEGAIPRGKWARVNELMVRFGQEVCRTAHPRCRDCGLTSLCGYYRERYRRGKRRLPGKG